ncbi:hypothetical protein [Ottowia thiooxydans]|uniref:hypothetical protein n=1 Tax=Ottowia thiooxydans TaxID=219182 RepID=UPI0003FE903F|nr:hypothetical protein [Ottowia thiooxydans]
MTTASLARQFAVKGFLLLLLSGLLVTWVALSQLREMAYDEAKARAHLIAEDMADHVQLAVNLGIPIDRLVGVEDLFTHRMQSFKSILRAALVDTQGQVLQERGTSQGEALPLVVVPITMKGMPVARLELLWRQPAVSALLLTWGLPVAVLTALIAGLAAEALRYALRGRVLRRELLVREACERIAAGDLATRPPRIGRKDFDQRLPWLAEQLRHAGDQHLRIERLAQSLRQTEPDFDKRHQLDRVLAETLGDDRFSLPLPRGGTTTTLSSQSPGRSHSTGPIPVSSKDALQRWRGVLLGLLAWAPITALAGYPLSLVGACAFAMLAAVLGIAHYSHWWKGTAPAWYGALLGGLVFGPGLSLLAQMACAPRSFQASNGLGYAILGVCGLAALSLPLIGNRVRESKSKPGMEPHAA